MKDKATFAGDIPVGDILMAAGDEKYWLEYGEAFVNSAFANANAVHIHLFNIQNHDLCFGLQKKIELRWNRKLSLSFDTNQHVSRSKMASVRFHVAPLMIEAAASLGSDLRLMILDIDSVVRKKIKMPNAAVGLHWRKPFGNEWEQRGTRVAAGAVFYDSTALNFAKRVSEKINELEDVWFVDQVALAETADEFHLAIAIHDFGKDHHFLDWEFHDDGAIWTGKGDRKHNDKRYLEEVESWK